ncbi:MAG: acyl-CoA carboxylase subunit epsilon [Dermatophilaceae bacterium]
MTDVAPDAPPAAAAAPVPQTITVTAGSPTPEDIAVVVALFTALANAETVPSRRRPRLWSTPSWQLRPHLTPVPGGWRLSGLRM